MGSRSVRNLRDDLDVLVETVASEACRCTPSRLASGSLCGPCQARRVREWLDVTGVRLRRWRNGIGGPTLSRVRHVAGPVEVTREPRRSCPGYIVDRHQLCSRCGAELVRGKWAVFLDPGSSVSRIRDAAGVESHAQPWTPLMSGMECNAQESAREFQITNGRAMIDDMSTTSPARRGGTPYGWVRTPDGALEVDPQAQSVRVAVLRLVRLNYTQDRIAAILNNAGTPAPGAGSSWTQLKIQRIVGQRIDDVLLQSIFSPDASILDSIAEAAQEFPEKRVRRPRRTRQKTASVA